MPLGFSMRRFVTACAVALLSVLAVAQAPPIPAPPPTPRHPVTDGYQGVTVVEKGVQAGETVVTDGQLRIIPGAKVQITNTGSESGSGGAGSAGASTSPMAAPAAN